SGPATPGWARDAGPLVRPAGAAPPRPREGHHHHRVSPDAPAVLAEEPVGVTVTRAAQRMGHGDHRGQLPLRVPATDGQHRRDQWDSRLPGREGAVSPAGEYLRGSQQPPAEPLLLRRPRALRRDDFEFTDEQSHATTMPAAASRGDLLTDYEGIACGT